MCLLDYIYISYLDNSAKLGLHISKMRKYKLCPEPTILFKEI
jgi:hypothetical protein